MPEAMSHVPGTKKLVHPLAWIMTEDKSPWIQCSPIRSGEAKPFKFIK